MPNLRKFIIKRVARAAATLLFILLFVFIGARVTGNPFEVMFPDGITNEVLAQFNKQFGLDQPIPVQFARYVQRLVVGDFGVSIAQRRPVTAIFAEGMSHTLQLGVWALALCIIVGLALGIITAIRPRSIASRVALGAMSVGYAIPSFIIAIFLILTFSFYLHWLPSLGGGTALSYVMPVLALSAHPTAMIARYTRSSLREVLSQDYIRTAVAKGIGSRSVVMDHALRNVLIPIVTVVGILVTDIIGGSVIIESMFSWPGVGGVLVDAVMNRDFPVVQFGVICFSAIVIVANLAVDIAYVLIDPRIRVEA